MTKRTSMIPTDAVFDRRLGNADIRVLCALAAFCDRQGKCWPATTTIAQKLGVSDRRIRSCLRKLESTGYVLTEHRPGSRSIYLIIREPVDPGTSASGVDPGTSASGVDPGTSASGGAEPELPGTPETELPPNIDTTNTKNNYAFDGRVIRLTHGDFDKWATAYSHIELRAELQALDDFYDRELTGPARKKWYQRCSQALNNKNRKARAERQTANGEADSDTIY